VTRKTRLRRLCALRRLQELDQAAQLELARAELARIEGAMREAELRKGAGRLLFSAGAQRGDLGDRVTGIEEVAGATRLGQALLLRQSAALELVRRMQAQYLFKREQRCQVETLLRIESEREALIEQRKSQSSLDEWHRTRRDCVSQNAASDKYSADLPED